MAWNPSPKVAFAREYARKFGADQIVIVAIDNKGETKALCNATEELAVIAYDAIFEKLASL